MNIWTKPKLIIKWNNYESMDYGWYVYCVYGARALNTIHNIVDTRRCYSIYL